MRMTKQCYIFNNFGSFYKTKNKLKMALTIILSCGVIFLVLSLVGTCGANMKNEILLSLYTITMSILWTCEIVVTFRSVSKLYRIGFLVGKRSVNDESFLKHHFEIENKFSVEEKGSDYNRFCKLVSK